MKHNSTVRNVQIYGAMGIGLLLVLFLISIMLILHYSNNRVLLSLFSFLFLSVGIAFLHIYYNNLSKLRMRKFIDGAEKNLEVQIRAIRHRHRNQLQIIIGYLEMGLNEDALDYINRSDLNTTKQNLDLGVPELEIILFDKLRKAKLAGIFFDLDLNWIPINGTQKANACKLVDQVLEYAFQQLQHVKDNQLMGRDISQSTLIRSGLMLEVLGDQLVNLWFIEIVLNGIPVAASQSLLNKLVSHRKLCEQYGFTLTHEIRGATMNLKIASSVDSNN